jgi:hypothetical protein
MMLMDNKSHYNNLNLLYTKCTIKALSKFPPNPDIEKIDVADHADLERFVLN